ncbi:unnamed protein product [Angiostrongylus costaricensis]|uniref:DUF1816 domain-containing protein n=1 Tax=Angiostrongylus costaricensis TaxID=334426 RepID=A0A0R3PDX3_ANGCS|nr:unnamed protein product [Angiostrongylus costaricensis]
METEFSVDIFEQADSVRFWVQVNVERQLQVGRWEYLWFY